MPRKAPAKYDLRAMASTSSPARTGESFFAGVIESIKDKGLKYMLVSVANVLFGGGLLLAFQTEMSPIAANALAIAISSVPAYCMSRIWVWGKSGKSHFK